jgi:hypothetical protein
MCRRVVTLVARAPNTGRRRMAVDTFMAYVGVYPSVADAEADYV